MYLKPLRNNIIIHLAEKKSKLAEIKTKPNAASVLDFIDTIKDEQKRKDSLVILEMMKKATGGRAKYVGQLSYRFWQ